MVKPAQSNQNIEPEILFIGMMGAVAGAISAVIATFLMDRTQRQTVGKFINSLSEKAFETIADLNQISGELKQLREGQKNGFERR